MANWDIDNTGVLTIGSEGSYLQVTKTGKDQFKFTVIENGAGCGYLGCDLTSLNTYISGRGLEVLKEFLLEDKTNESISS